METTSKYRTYRWTRSPRGEVLGVATGLAEWRGFPPGITRLICLLIVLFCNAFGLIGYLLLALFLPMQTEADVISTTGGPTWRSRRQASAAGAYEAEWQDVGENRKSNEDLKREYEELKKKVETMESEMFDRERDWDERFNKDK